MRRLPADRLRSTTWKVKLDRTSVYVTIGCYADGTPAEVFVDVSKQGTALRDWSATCGKLTSRLLQYGAPLHDVVEALRGAPRNVHVIGHTSIQFCANVSDFVAQLLEIECGSASSAVVL